MPVANCIITPACQERSASSGNLIELWANESNKSSEHMTINIVVSSEQLGNKYSVMANLQLPTMWSSGDVSLLQTGLARALEQYYQLASGDVHVITSLVSSGRVVENGKEIHW